MIGVGLLTQSINFHETVTLFHLILWASPAPHPFPLSDNLWRWNKLSGWGRAGHSKQHSQAAIRGGTEPLHKKGFCYAAALTNTVRFCLCLMTNKEKHNVQLQLQHCACSAWNERDKRVVNRAELTHAKMADLRKRRRLRPVREITRWSIWF